MPGFISPVRDLTFVANELHKFEDHREAMGFEDADPDTIAAIFEEAGRMADEVFHPLNRVGDEQGCQLKDGKVTVPEGFTEAYKAYTEAGWSSLCGSTDYDGQGMPEMLGKMVGELFSASNHSLAMYPGLSHGAMSSLTEWASDDMKQKYLPKLITGEWTGTMNLTESHSGTDLGIIRTKAEPNGDGSYAITGSKIFISAGEHEMSENIIHLVLAKLPDAPPGTKGISLFIAPKFMVNDDGSLGERNALSCASLEHKMGIKGSATCVMNYDGATGFLVGEPHKGLRAMFTMMNAARLGVAYEGLGASEIAYQYAVEYAKDRLQGRALTGPKSPDKVADPIIHHADVRRMLLNMRSFNEGARALGGWTGMLLDISERHPDEAERERAEDLLGLLTPVCKAFFTDEGTANASTAVQVYGGHGYISEWGVEQLVRDARISQLYEGTNGIQSLDLVGRKLGQNGGRGLTTFMKEVYKGLKAEEPNDDMKVYVEPAQACLADLQAATEWFMNNAMQDVDNVGAAAVAYCRLFAITATAYMWVKMIRVAKDALAAGTDETEFYSSKLVVGKFFMEHYVAERTMLRARVEAGCETMMELPVDAF